jgi:hypothetical protein
MKEEVKKEEKITEDKTSRDSAEKLEIPKYGLDGNPLGSMAGLFSDTAEMDKSGDIEEEEPEAELGGNQPKAEPTSESDEAPAGDKDKPVKEKSQADEGSEKPEEDKKPESKVDPVKEARKFQGLYDKAKQEVEVAKELAARSVAQLLEAQEELKALRELKKRVEPHLSLLETKADIEEAMKNIQVPPDKMTGTDDEGNPVATEADKLSYLLMQRPDILARMIEQAAVRVVDKKLELMAQQQVKQSELHKEFLKRHPGVDLTPELINRINMKLSDSAKRIIQSPDVEIKIKNVLVDEAYKEVLAETAPESETKEEKAAEKTPEEIEEEIQERMLEEKRAKLLKSKTGLTQAARLAKEEIGDFEEDYNRALEVYIDKKSKCPLV